MFDDNDKIFDELLTSQLLSYRFDASMRRKVLADLAELEKTLIGQIQNSRIDEVTFKARRFKELLAAVKFTINDVYSSIDTKVGKDLSEYVTLESQFISATLSDLVVATSVAIPVNKLNSIYSNSLIEGAPSSDWWKRQSLKLRNNFEDNIRQGLLLGESNNQLVQRIRGTRAFGFKNGVMNTTRSDAEALIRSSVQTVANQARFETLEFNHDIIASYRHVSTLDSRTSDQCIVRDGVRWDAVSKSPIGHNIPFRVPPIHWNCRSTLVPELKGIDPADDAKRASAEGPVKASMTFETYLKGKSESFQDDVLGKGKAQLYRDKKITLRQLLDQSGNPLTLSELRSKYNK